MTPELTNWQTRITDFSDFEWKLANLKQTALDHFYTSGHMLYRARFGTNYSTGKLHLHLNIRHRCTIFINGQFVGGHTTYSRQLFFPGCKAGPELFSSFGTQHYELTNLVHPQGHNESNEIIVMVENWGLCRQAVVFNDATNPRGILSGRISGLKWGSRTVEWAVCGVDVRGLEIPFSTSGFPDEHKRTGWIDYRGGISAHGALPSDGVRWWTFQFRHPINEQQKAHLVAPLRLVLDGAFSSYIFLNGTLIGQYHGNGDIPQHDFYLMDGLLSHSELNTIVMMVYTWQVVDKEQVTVEVRGWEIDDVHKTGNIIKLRNQSADEYELRSWIVWRESIALNNLQQNITIAK